MQYDSQYTKWLPEMSSQSTVPGLRLITVLLQAEMYKKLMDHIHMYTAVDPVHPMQAQTKSTILCKSYTCSARDKLCTEVHTVHKRTVV